MSKIQTYTGLAFDYLNPSPEMVDIRDIAHSLATAPRFNGHLSVGISVAGHCVTCAEALRGLGYSYDICLQALLHDASEAYIGDIPKPLKELLPEARVIEGNIHEVIAKALESPYPFHEAVHKIDVAAMVKESEYLNGHNPEVWGHIEVLKKKAGKEFLNAYVPFTGIGLSMADVYLRAYVYYKRGVLDGE